MVAAWKPTLRYRELTHCNAPVETNVKSGTSTTPTVVGLHLHSSHSVFYRWICRVSIGISVHFQISVLRDRKT